MEENNCTNECTSYTFIKVDTTLTDGQSTGFKNWIKGIKYEGKYIILPDEFKIDGMIWVTNQKQFDSGSYTRFLINYYNDNIV